MGINRVAWVGSDPSATQGLASLADPRAQVLPGTHNAPGPLPGLPASFPGGWVVLQASVSPLWGGCCWRDEDHGAQPGSFCARCPCGPGLWDGRASPSGLGLPGAQHPHVPTLGTPWLWLHSAACTSQGWKLPVLSAFGFYLSHPCLGHRPPTEGTSPQRARGQTAAALRAPGEAGELEAWGCVAGAHLLGLVAAMGGTTVVTVPTVSTTV